MKMIMIRGGNQLVTRNQPPPNNVEMEARFLTLERLTYLITTMVEEDL